MFSFVLKIGIKIYRSDLYRLQEDYECTIKVLATPDVSNLEQLVTREKTRFGIIWKLAFNELVESQTYNVQELDLH